MGSRPLKDNQYDESVYEKDLHFVLKAINFITGLPYRLWGNRMFFATTASVLVTYIIYNYGTYLIKLLNM